MEDAQFAALVQAEEEGISERYAQVTGVTWRYDVHGTGPAARDGLYVEVDNKASLGGYDPEFVAYYLDKFNEKEIIARARTSFRDMVEANDNYIKALAREQGRPQER